MRVGSQLLTLISGHEEWRVWRPGSESGQQTMTDSGNLVLQVHPAPEDDAGELAELAGLLRAELLDLDVQGIEQLDKEAVPDGAKGIAAVAGWLGVNLGPAAIRAVLAKVADWATRNDRVVEVGYAGDTLKLSKATREQQQKIIDDWLGRHPKS